MDWLTRVAEEQRAVMAQWGYTPEDVAAAADEDHGEQGEVEGRS
jgi:hypothetical protein